MEEREQATGPEELVPVTMEVWVPAECPCGCGDRAELTWAALRELSDMVTAATVVPVNNN